MATFDAAFAYWLAQRLDRQQSDPQFLYRMTLNSHLPVNVPGRYRQGFLLRVASAWASVVPFAPGTN